MNDQKLLTFQEILKRTRAEKFALGSFNFSSFDQLQGIFKAAEKLKSPFILSTSEGEADFLGFDLVAAMISFFQKRLEIPFILNLDHGKDISKIKKAIDKGYDMVHFDGSELSYEENLTRTKEVVDYAHSKGVLVEGEIGRLGGSSSFHQDKAEIKQEDLTDPLKAEAFTRESGVDFLAIAAGNIHGIFAKGNPALDIPRIQQIREKTDVFLSLHGGSGITDEALRRAIEAGIVKININTEVRLAYTNTLRNTLLENSQENTPYKYLPMVIDAVSEVIEAKIKVFGSDNKH